MAGNPLRSWSTCDHCGFQGTMEHRTRPGEDYSDGEAPGVMMDVTCPARECTEGVLVVMEEYREMLFLAGQRPR